MGFPNPSNRLLSISLGCRPEFPRVLGKDFRIVGSVPRGELGLQRRGKCAVLSRTAEWRVENNLWL